MVDALGRIKGNLDFALGLRRFLREDLPMPAARALIEGQLARRTEAFLETIERGVYARERSPYRLLLRHVGIELADLKRLVADHGIEGALDCLYDAGVYVSLDEFKGRRPIQRPGFELATRPSDFDNPLMATDYVAVGSGTTGAPTRSQVSLDQLAYESAHVACQFEAFDLGDVPVVNWLPAPPDSAGLKNVLRTAKLRHAPERWFSQRRFAWRPDMLRAIVFLGYVYATARLTGRPIPWPRFVPRDQAVVVARWLATRRRDGRPAYLETSASAATRVCIAAKENGLDISGSIIRCAGEPLTPAKAAILDAAGVRSIERYTSVETGIIGIGCPNATGIDDLHLFTDKVAVIQRDVAVGAGASEQALIYSSVHATPKLLLNFISGDSGVLSERDCGCLFGELGLRTIVQGLGSYDKLTSEGVTFLGSDLYRLVEEVLPVRFGGAPTDYQLVEEEEGGLPKVSVLVAPSVGRIDEAAVLDTVLATLSSRPSSRLMTDQWRQGETLRVVRREPYASGGGRKVFPLYILRAPAVRDGERG